MIRAHVIEAPTGRFVIVGKVPTSVVTDDKDVQQTLSQCGEGLARTLAKLRGVRFTTSYSTREEAEWALAKALCIG